MVALTPGGEHALSVISNKQNYDVAPGSDRSNWAEEVNMSLSPGRRRGGQADTDPSSSPIHYTLDEADTDGEVM